MSNTTHTESIIPKNTETQLVSSSGKSKGEPRSGKVTLGKRFIHEYIHLIRARALAHFKQSEGGVFSEDVEHSARRKHTSSLTAT